MNTKMAETMIHTKPINPIGTKREGDNVDFKQINPVPEYVKSLEKTIHGAALLYKK